MAPDLLMQAQLTYPSAAPSLLIAALVGFSGKPEGALSCKPFVDFSLEMSQLAILRDVEMQTLYLDFYRELRLLLILS